MTTVDIKSRAQEELFAEINELSWQLKEANSIISAIRGGEIDALLISEKKGDQVYILQGADYVYREIVEEMQEGYITLSKDGVILFSNKNFAQMLLNGLDQVIGMSIYEMLSPLEAEAFRRSLTGNKDHFKREFSLKAANGLFVSVLASVNCCFDKPQFAYMIVTDLTEQKRSEQSFMYRVFDQATEAFIVCDVAGQIVRVNKVATELFGTENLHGAFDQTIMLYGENDETLFSLKDTLRDGNISFIEARYTKRDGKNVALMVSVGQIIGPNPGENIGFLVTLTDITERKQYEAQLNHLNTELEKNLAELQEVNAAMQEEISERKAAEVALRESRDKLVVAQEQLEYYAAEVAATNTELKSFVNTIAHDFRSPMINLKGFSSELEQSLKELKKIMCESESILPREVQKKIDELLDEDVTEAQQIINSAVNRLNRLVDALLKLSQMGRREMSFEEVDLSNIVNTILQSHNHQITEKKIQIEVGTLMKINSDYLAMEQIIGNLVDNAIKFLDPIRLGKLELTCFENKNVYVVSIEDNGRGIDVEDYEKIFDPFRRSGENDQPGEGLGLAYVRTLVRKLGGRVWCESEVGVGTKMSFTTPTKQLANETPSTERKIFS